MKKRDDDAALAMLRADAVLVEQALNGYLSGDDAQLQTLLDAQRYSTFAGGKRIRPALY